MISVSREYEGFCAHSNAGAFGSVSKHANTFLHETGGNRHETMTVASLLTDHLLGIYCAHGGTLRKASCKSTKKVYEKVCPSQKSVP